MYSNGGSEFTTLKHFLVWNSTCYFTSLHTTESSSSRKKTLYQACLPHTFWSFACSTATYLINRLRTATFSSHSLYQSLFNSDLSLSNLKTFDCLCCHKLDPRFTPCVFGFSTQYHSHQCFDLILSKIYLSQDVLFLNNKFSYHSRFKAFLSSSTPPSWHDLRIIYSSPLAPSLNPPPGTFDPVTSLISLSKTKDSAFKLSIHTNLPTNNVSKEVILSSDSSHSDHYLVKSLSSLNSAQPSSPLSTQPTISLSPPIPTPESCCHPIA